MELKCETSTIPKEATVIVGVSGGRDSMALIHTLLTKRKDLTLIPAHVNHGLRHDAEEDAEFTAGMMARWNLKCEVYKPRAKKAGNTEEWGRNKRYEFFEKLRKKHGASNILTAHHQDDDFESMLLAFLRGTRVKGMSGMAFQRQYILRPLLFTSRSTINDYIEDKAIPYREDPSNADEQFSRNFLRHKVIPVLNHVYPEMAARWQNQKEYWQDLQTLLEEDAQIFLDEHLTKDGLSRAPYKEIPFPLRATILELWYKESTGKRVPDSATLKRWDQAVMTWNSRKKTEWDEGQFLVMNKEQARLS